MIEELSARINRARPGKGLPSRARARARRSRLFTGAYKRMRRKETHRDRADKRRARVYLRAAGAAQGLGPLSAAPLSRGSARRADSIGRRTASERNTNVKVEHERSFFFF